MHIIHLGWGGGRFSGGGGGGEMSKRQTGRVLAKSLPKCRTLVSVFTFLVFSNLKDIPESVIFHF